MKNRHLHKAKRLDNGEWVEGYYLYDGVTGKSYVHAIGNCLNESGKVGEEGCLKLVAFEVEVSTLCQCTGLKDKNDKLIWENDIVRACSGALRYVHGVVKFGKYGNIKTDYGFYIEWEKTQPYWRNDLGFWRKDIKIIGNIFDNPELLEVGE